ncbi:MAG TPA: hypothetical protein VFC42_02960 [Methylomirabilota bacterium]|nr:hypothetical protein [Methylomirabilota bacterium]
MRRRLAAGAAAWLLGLSIETAPHLVHHLFDVPDAAASECVFLATAAHVPGASAPPASLLLLAASGEQAPVSVVSASPAPQSRPAAARSPPPALDATLA